MDKATKLYYTAGFTCKFTACWWLCTLQVFPAEVLGLPELVCLKMRNNPIRDIPSGERKKEDSTRACDMWWLLILSWLPTCRDKETTEARDTVCFLQPTV